MSMEQKLKTRGILTLVSFAVVLVLIFMPIFPGKVNGLDYMDNLFNMVSKGSSYFIPKAIEDSGGYSGKTIEVTIAMASADRAGEAATMFSAAGAQTEVNDNQLTIKGDVALITGASLADADLFFSNNSAPVGEKYGFSGKQAMYNWWNSFKAIATELNKQEKFSEAKLFASVQQRAIEPAYNYYGIEARNWKDNIALILFSLVFYVVYTLWYGFGLLWLFEGLGLKISH